MWRITFRPRAQKDMLALDRVAASQVMKKLESVSENPLLSFEKLSGFDYQKLRAGDYRAIAFLDFKTKTIDVHRIGHRKNIYQKL